MLTKTKEEKYQENLKKVKENPFHLRYIPKDEQTEELCLSAVRQDGWALEYVQEQTEEICLAAVRQNGNFLQFVENQTEAICLAAVKQNPWALQYVQRQTLETCLTAVQQNGMVLMHVKKQTPALCLAAVRQSGRALEYVQEQTEEICLAAVQENGWALEFVSTDYYEEVSKQTGAKLFHCKNRPILVEKINNEWVFSVGCQARISKETFIQRIHKKDGGLAENPHRQEYLDLLEQF